MSLVSKLQRLDDRAKNDLRTGFYTAFEWKEILRKRSLYQDVRWSKQQQKDFDAFWQHAYNKRISNRWHRMYESYNGVFNVEYVPEILYTSKIEPRMNEAAYGKVLSNKALFELIYQDASVRFPETIALTDGRTCFDSRRRVIGTDRFIDLLSNAGEVVIKPSSGFGSGHGIVFANFNCGIDLSTGKTVKDVLTGLITKEVIVQRYFHQNSVLSSINPTSLNSIRVTTYIVDGKVYYAPLTMRCGSGKSRLDNIHSGGLVIAVNDNGTLGKTAYRLGHTDVCERMYAHPNSGVVFANINLPHIDKVIDVARNLHGRTPHIGIIGWDFSMDGNGKPTIIEANYHGNSVWFPQICHGKGIFGEHTEYLIQKYT
jgi:hypothetical protein